jgi:uncharacterized protein (DUF433 family)
MAKEYIELRPEGYYIAGTRVSLASIVLQFRQGAAPETILQNYPAVGSLENVYGTIAFYLANQSAVESYLEEHERQWREFRDAADPLPSALAERLAHAQQPRPR